MAVTGQWTLHFDWGFTGGYGNTPMTVNANGTWTNGEGYSGTWFQAAGMFVFTFNNSTVVYAGNISYMSVTGTQRGVGAMTGAFYMLQQGAAAAQAAAVAAGAPDSSGKKSGKK